MGPVTRRVPACVEGEVVGGDARARGWRRRRFRGSRPECRGDLEDGAGAVADEEVAVAVEGDAGGDAHAFGEGGDGAVGGDAVDGAFGAGAGVEVAVGVEGEAGDVEQVADEGADLEVALRCWKMETGTVWPRGAGEGGVDVAVGVDGGVGDGVEILGHGDGDAEVEGVAGGAVAMEDEVAGDGAFGDADDGAGGAGEGEGGGDVADGDVGDCRLWNDARKAPWTSISPPGMAAVGMR